MPPNDLWEYVLQAKDEGKKYLDILNHKFHFSKGLLQQLKQGEKVWVNGKFTFLSTRGKAGETLSIQLFPAEESSIPGEALPLDILYEDEFLLAVNKPAGQVVHPNPRYPSGTVGNSVVGYWESKGEFRPFRPVHRIDRNTSGLVVIAKNQFAHQQMAWQLERGLIDKRYWGIVEGRVSSDSGTIDAPIALLPGSYIVRTISSHGLPALTHYQVLERYTHTTLVEFRPITGRTHQIRVHCQFLGHSLLGDDLYGGTITTFSRQALHSMEYSFLHPATGQPLTLKAPLPFDMESMIEKTQFKADQH